MGKIFILNEKRYKQIEIECSCMGTERTILFLVPEAEETKHTLYLNECLYGYHFSIAEILKDAKENNMDLYYMCTISFDDGEDNVVNELVEG